MFYREQGHTMYPMYLVFIYMQAAGSPIIRNLLRVVAYQRRISVEEPLTTSEQGRVQATVDNLTDSLRTILCL